MKNYALNSLNKYDEIKKGLKVIKRSIGQKRASICDMSDRFQEKCEVRNEYRSSIYIWSDI
jgi:hypothetical protein